MIKSKDSLQIAGPKLSLEFQIYSKKAEIGPFVSLHFYRDVKIYRDISMLVHLFV